MCGSDVRRTEIDPCKSHKIECANDTQPWRDCDFPLRKASPQQVNGDESRAMQASPDHKGPGRSMPQSAEHHGRHQIQEPPPLAISVAAQRDIQIITKPEGQCDVPAAPEL